MSKTVLITGASVGIGAATAKLFAANGYDVVINYFHSQDEAEKVATDCKKHGVKAFTVQADCSKEEGIQKLAKETQKAMSKLDVLVNNFGIAIEPKFEDLSQESILTVMNNNLFPTIMTTSIFVPKYMNTRSSVLNLGTIYALNQSGSLGLPVYSAAKAGVINFTQTMAKKFAPNIRFNAVIPGFTKTPHWDPVSKEVQKACIDSTLEKEWIEPEDIAKTLLFLAETPHIDAETIVVDAGWSKR